MRVVAWGMVLQVAFALLILKTAAGEALFDTAGSVAVGSEESKALLRNGGTNSRDWASARWSLSPSRAS